MTLQKSNAATIVGTILATVLACCHLLDTLFETANGHLAQGVEPFVRPGIVQALSAPVLLPGALVLFSLIILVTGGMSKKYPQFGGDRKSVPMGVIGLLAAGAMGYTLVSGLIGISKENKTPVPEVGAEAQLAEQAASGVSDLAWQICMGIGICGALALGVVSVGFFLGRNMLENTPMLMIMPVLWLGMRLVLTFLELTSHASIAERSIELVMLVVMTLFMVSLGKFLAGVSDKSGKWACVYGGLTALFAFATGISRLVLMLYGRNALEGALTEDYAKMTESYGLKPDFGDIALGIFAVAMIVNVSIRQREEEDEMAFGRKRRRDAEQEMAQQRQMQQGMYQQPWPAQPGMYQQRPMQPNMYQQNMMRQQQMQQNMMRQQQMQQNMYRQQMMQQMQQQQMQQMQQMQQNMYQQQMQQNMMQQNMMRQQQMQQNNMNDGYGVSEQPVESPARQPEQRHARPNRGGGRGMRMPDSFEVRSYGGPSINSRKKFGGLDSFRDQMLSGQSALNMQSEELPPPPPPTVNLTDEEAAMQAVLAASLAAEEVNGDIDQLTEQIMQSVERIPEGPKDKPSTDVELEIPEDETVISVLDDDEDDHSDEREYPAPPATRTVTLGSGRHEGTLTDRLAELEELKRREERRRPPQPRYEEEEYYDDYEEYADEYDEYEDEYEEYEDDYDYEEYEYEDGYEDDYDEYDEYDDGYDDEYDDEYYDEYEDEYDEDDYYDDDDDGYYEE